MRSSSPICPPLINDASSFSRGPTKVSSMRFRRDRFCDQDENFHLSMFVKRETVDTAILYSSELGGSMAEDFEDDEVFESIAFSSRIFGKTTTVFKFFPVSC
ncbi:unnamed protein product [Pseudo-nitzschia multistriata]|uniref:Uncharacterized protein n=1 Tax=Pseudo-nitzschia multistriata TaxID=183589 RepID=A0A448Z4R9_9STRA|nr:unnamed protein product [Pseudo-nitzschia multistriata]